MAIAVDVEGVTKFYGKTAALENVSFSIDAGSALGLVGPNGAGKSTLLKMLLGLMRPTRGAIYYNGQPLWPDPASAMRQVGGFVDTPRFYPYLTGRENLMMLAELTHGSARRVDEALHYVHLDGAAEQRVGGYSHGMRQRLGIAAALMKRPGLIILDEPEDGLDPARLAEMRQLLGRVRQEYGSTLIMSSHVISDIERLCDRIAVFDNGRIRYVGPVNTLGSRIPEEILWELWPVERGLRYLRNLGLDARPAGEGRIAAVWDGSLDLGQVNAALIREGLAVRTVMRRTASLESRLLAYLEDSHVDVR
ncbi:MAG: ABC transporter ATP-binding protein [Firmicutes bacterium]|nr:ABC transporter ATP-binding protein [Bacillota bacterium]